MAPRSEELTVAAAGRSAGPVLLEARHVSKTYATRDGVTETLRGVSFRIHEGEFVCLCGPSGCGKTTLLRCIGGLLELSAGSVRLEGATIREPPADLAIVFQDYSRSLLPWMRVAENVAFPLESRGLTASRRREQVDDALASVGLADARRKYPWQLSGGMQQRVAIARALAYEPKILLMDEPFASVDAQTRGELEDLMLRLQRSQGLTVLLVTHDVDEAVYLGDRVVVLTPRPATVDTIVTVDLTDPRDQLTTRSLPDFGALRKEVLARILDPESRRP